MTAATAAASSVEIMPSTTSGNGRKVDLVNRGLRADSDIEMISRYNDGDIFKIWTE
jgi:hypothetical protein